MRPVLQLEINEVPWRLLDRYRGDESLPFLNRFLEQSHHYTTIAQDTGELSPWVTWPTFHRGLNNDEHGIRNLGQDPSTFRGTPIWEDLRAAGHDVGVFGSMQSWPPKDPGVGGFWVPDTFAHDASCIPPRISALQAFNLSQVKRNARTVKGGMPALLEVMGVIPAMAAAGVSARTMARVAVHLIKERLNPELRLLRPTFQTLLFWDSFKSVFNPSRPPVFSSFFTNHVAGVMHRFWRDVFPEDFGRLEKSGEREWVMRHALIVLDGMMADVLSWMTINPRLVVIFASSMGQGAVHRTGHQGLELVVRDVHRLMAAIGVERTEYRPLLAMVPQVAVSIANDAVRIKAAGLLSSISLEGYGQFITCDVQGSGLSITINTPKVEALATRSVYVADGLLTLGELGIGVEAVDAGTGYHVPEGTLLVASTNCAKPLIQERSPIKADQMKQWLLDLIQDDQTSDVWGKEIFSSW